MEAFIGNLIVDEFRDIFANLVASIFLKQVLIPVFYKRSEGSTQYLKNYFVQASLKGEPHRYSW